MKKRLRLWLNVCCYFCTQSHQIYMHRPPVGPSADITWTAIHNPILLGEIHTAVTNAKKTSVFFFVEGKSGNRIQGQRI